MLSRSFTRREQAIMAALALAIVAGAGTVLYLRLADRPATNPAEGHAALAAIPVAPAAALPPAVPPEPVPSPSADAAEPLKLTVAVRGAVKYPGVYELGEGRRVHDLLERAGGTTELADLRDINIAAPLLDGTTLTVPSVPDPATGLYTANAYPSVGTLNPAPYTVTGWRPGASAPGASSGSGGGGGLIDLNRATQAELETLPGIGPVTAASIIAYREQQPFTAVDELEQVSGIGPKRLESVRELVTVSGR